MSDERFPYLKNFLKPTRWVGAKSDKTTSAKFSALLAPVGLVRPGRNYSSGEGDTGGLLEEFQHRAVPLKVTPNTAPQARVPGERILSCADCGFHRYSGPNPAHSEFQYPGFGQGCVLQPQPGGTRECPENYPWYPLSFGGQSAGDRRIPGGEAQHPSLD